VITARGVPLATLLERAEAAPEADTAIFHYADGYFTTHPLTDLIETEAYLAYEINGQEIPAHGFPLRLVAPGKYGYKWAKWVVRIELAAGSPMGYWEQRGLPDRAWVGDLR
jgi:DMSO/TMAO reductase YedYZ molybdopterin-dependent catalytic subunit